MQEQVWPIRELEAFAIVWAILHFAEYLRGQECFTVRTDHESLKWLWGTDNKRVARWALALQEFQFKVLYQKGSNHHHVDIFTRDVPITPMDESLTNRIALTADVFTVAPVCQLQRDPCDVTFPTVEEFKEEQQKEADRDHSLEVREWPAGQPLWTSVCAINFAAATDVLLPLQSGWWTSGNNAHISSYGATLLVDQHES